MVETILLAVSLSVDALGIGVSYGVRNIKVPGPAKLIIMGMAVVITGMALFFGTLIASFLPAWAAKYLGVSILLFLGLWIIVQSFKEGRGLSTGQDERKGEKPLDPTLFNFLIKSLGITIKIIRTPSSGDLDNSNTIEPAEALYLGAALSLDSMGAGIASAAIGIASAAVPVFTGLFQIIFLSAGLAAGVKLSRLNKDSKLWTRLSGAILIGLALVKMIY